MVAWIRTQWVKPTTPTFGPRIAGRDVKSILEEKSSGKRASLSEKVFQPLANSKDGCKSVQIFRQDSFIVCNRVVSLSQYL